MSYENRIFVVDTWRTEYNSTLFPEIIADYSLSRLDYDVDGKVFDQIFDIDVDFELYGDNDFELTFDKYGKRIKAAKIQTVIEYLKKYREIHWHRRIAPVIAMLEVFEKNADEWNNNLLVVHYGY